MISLLALSLFWTIVCAIIAAGVLVPLLLTVGSAVIMFLLAVVVGIGSTVTRKRRDAKYRSNYPFNRS